MRFWLLLLPFLAVAAKAQNDRIGRHGSGTVTGHVYCADTNAPARMASVQLAPVKAAEQRSATYVQFNGELPAGGVAQTGFDGGFTLTRVPPGSYYVIVVKAGYLSPRSNDDDSDDVEPQPPAGQPPVVVPRVDVQANQSASIDVRLERGGAISGTVRFDDGSPASGVSIMVLHRKKDKWVPSNGPIFSMMAPPATDDLGHYRVSGLRDRDYLVMIQLSRTDLESRGSRAAGLSGVERSALRIYSGDTPHVSEAVPVKLGAGEERSGEDITIPLNKYHSVSGVVTAAADGHAVNSGHLLVEDPNEKESIVEAELGSDGAFHLEGVPEGTYMLRVQNPSDKQIQEMSAGGDMRFVNEKVIHQYADFAQTLKVEGDIPSLVLTVTEQKRRAATTGSQ